jgi:hypothetical protein
MRINFKREVWRETFSVASLSFLLMCILRPEFFVAAQIRFTGGHDIEVPFTAAFMHAEYFMNGAVDLWNRFEQFNNSYLHLGGMIHSPIAVLEGALFAPFREFLTRPGEAFHHFHAIAYYFIACLVRTAGGVALLSLFGVGGLSRVICLVLLNTVMAGQTYVGNLTGFTYSLCPLIIFFIEYLRRERQFVLVFWTLAALTTAFSTTPLFALSYFYLPVHFLIFGQAILAAVEWYKSRTKKRTSSHLPWKRWDLGLGALAIVWIGATNLKLFLVMAKTYSLFGSGLNGTSGRFGRALNPVAYFRGVMGGAPWHEFFKNVMNFEFNDWIHSWMYVGALTFGLSIVGLILSRRREKWVYAATVVLVILVQFDRQAFSIGHIAHVISAFTNPFSFLTVNFHMSSLFVFYFMLPLVAFGLEELHARRGPPKTRKAMAIGVLICVAVFSVLENPKGPAVLSVAVLAILITLLLFHRKDKQLSVGLLFMALLMDLVGFRRFLQVTPYTNDKIQPRLFKGLEDSGPVVIDYQNPEAMPLPMHLYVGPERDLAGPESPSTDPMYPGPAVYFVRSDDPGAFFHTIFCSRNFAKKRLYEQRHIQYVTADEDPILERHLTQHDSFIYHAQVALDADKHSLSELTTARVDDRAVLLKDSGAESPVGISSSLPKLISPPSPLALEKFALDVAAGTLRARPELVELDIPLPKEFPNWMNTTIFGRDRKTIRLKVDGKEYVAAQGHLIRPYTFDVGNVRTGFLVAALPTAQTPASIVLEVDRDPIIKSVWRRTNDVIGLDYMAPSDGWLVMRNPYEEGWRATVDGARTPVHIANTTSMAVRVHRGLNKVLFEYKPGFSLHRILVYGYIVFAPLLLFLVVAKALHLAAVSQQEPN